MPRLAALLFVLPPFAPACAVLAQEPAPHAAWHGILEDVVRDGRVDYVAVRDRHWDALTGYLEGLAEVDVSKLKPDSRLAHYINLYNASMFRAVVEHYSGGWTPVANEWGIFNEKLVRTKSGAISLNHLENEIVRKQFDEPRIHVALVCGAVSCPPIRAFAYTAANLERTLEENMRGFVNDPTRNRPKQRKLSSIFNWYIADFGGKQSTLRSYIARYTDAKLPSGKFEWLDYDWSLNDIASSDRVVTRRAVKAGGSSIAAGVPLTVLEREDDRVRVRLPFGRGEAWLPAKAFAR